MSKKGHSGINVGRSFLGQSNAQEGDSRALQPGKSAIVASHARSWKGKANPDYQDNTSVPTSKVVKIEFEEDSLSAIVSKRPAVDMNKCRSKRTRFPEYGHKLYAGLATLQQFVNGSAVGSTVEAMCVIEEVCGRMEVLFYDVVDARLVLQEDREVVYERTADGSMLCSTRYGQEKLWLAEAETEAKMQHLWAVFRKYGYKADRFGKA